MSPERVIPFSRSISPPAIEQNILQAKGISTPEQLKQLLLNGAEKITTAIEPVFPAGFESVFLNELKKKNTKIIIVSNHQSHADILSVAKVSKVLTEMANKVLPEEHKFPGFQLIIASSLIEGDQGMFLQECVNQMVTNVIPGYFLSAIEYMRQKDALIHNERLRKEGKAMNRFRLKAFRASKNLHFGLQLARGIKKGKGTVIFLPGNVQEGKTKENGEIFGLRKIDSNLVRLANIIKMAMKIHPINEKPLIICMGTHGGFKVLSPDTLSLTPEAFSAIDSNNPESLIQVKLSMPKRIETIAGEIRERGERINSKNINGYMLRAIAELLPFEAQGIYRKV